MDTPTAPAESVVVATPVVETPAPAAPVATPAEPASPATPAAPAEPSVSKREELYAKYDALYGNKPAPPAEPAAPAAVPIVVETPVAPTAVVPEAAPAAPVSPAGPSAADAAIASIADAMKALAAQVTALTPKPVVEPVVEPEPLFTTKLREGDVPGAMQAMREAILADINKAPKGTSPEVLVQRAIEKVQLESELTTFLTTTRRDNPDIVPMESYIAGAVQARMNADLASGKLTGGPAYAQAYKTAVNEEIAKARTIIQQARAAGVTDARTTDKTVLAVSSVTPQAVVADRGVAPAAPAAPDISPATYLAKRAAASLSGKGL